MVSELPLSPLREELTLHPGPVARDGSPTWTLHDPVRHQFFRIDWPVFEVLCRWDEGVVATLLGRLHAETTLRLEVEEIRQVEHFLAEQNLLRCQTPQETVRLAAMAAARRVHWGSWLLHHYLFFRIPLLRPDRLLAALLPWLEPLYSPWFARLLGVALITGLLLLARQWESFVHTLQETLTWGGLLGYGVTLSLVKTLHELGHALTAKRLGCRVPTMGIAFLVLWPVLYSDTTDAWKLPNGWHRLAVAAGGLLAESTLAVLALLAWSFLPEGTGREAAFMICTTSLLSTLLINLSPFMRFDGYFILSDWLNIHNLHARSFALARWWLRERLFRLDRPPPESFLPWHRNGLILFALCTWIYRLGLFLGIAVLVYHFFIKAVGVALFLVEIGWFIVLPVFRELRVWWQLRQEILVRSRVRRLLPPLLLGVMLLIFPWQGWVSAPALLVGERHAILYAPGPGRLVAMPIREGQTVQTGDLMFELATPDLDFRWEQNAIRQRTLQWEWSAMGVESRLLERSQSLRQEIETAITAGIHLDREKARYRLTAPFSGLVVDLTPDQQVGQWLGTRERLGAVLAPEGAVIRAYPTEEDLARLTIGSRGWFYPEDPDWPPLPCRVIDLDRSSSRYLPDQALASRYGGPIPVREQGNQLLPEQAVYRLVLAVDQDSSPRITQQYRGTVRLTSVAQSLVDRFWRAILAVLIRESGM